MNHDFFNKSLATLNKNNQKTFVIIRKKFKQNNLSLMV